MSLYKMILVDDEEEVRTSIHKKVNWNELGFEVVGSMSNGEEALELTEHTHVDVVMTDIKMPFMDGLTLCAKVKENYKNTKVVLYSGFDDFEFAREAIRLEAEEYILKPIGAKDLENVFRKIKMNLDKEFDERRNIEKLNDYYQKSLPMMREQLLTGLLEGRVTENQAVSMMNSYGMDFTAPFYAVAILGGDFRKTENGIQNGPILMLSLLNIAKEYLEKHMDTQVFMYLDRIAVIVKLQKSREIQDFIYHMNQICKMGARMLGVDVDAGIGQIYSQLTKISVSCEEAKTAFDYRILLKDSSQAIYINDVEPKTDEVTFYEPQGIEKIIYCMKLGSKEELEQSVDVFVDELKNEKITMQQYQLTLLIALTDILRLLAGYEIEVYEVFGKNFEPYQYINGFHSMDELSIALQEICYKTWRLIRKERMDSTKAMTEKAKKYIEENYADSTLSVKHLCNHLNVSATYFSVMFKKETGMSFVSHLTKVRLEHAIELLETTEDKAYMIAEKVGYTEANYFSYVFKKQYGVSPSKYRSNKERKDEKSKV